MDFLITHLTFCKKKSFHFSEGTKNTARNSRSEMQETAQYFEKTGGGS
jgi:hypothetical protein